MTGYYNFKSSCGFVTDAFVQEMTAEECGFTVQCECCGKKLNKWISANYIDESDNEIEEVYGITCFKKISELSNSIEF